MRTVNICRSKSTNWFVHSDCVLIIFSIFARSICFTELEKNERLEEKKNVLVVCFREEGPISARSC